MKYEKLNQNDYDRVWDTFEARFLFKPDYYGSVPAISEPEGSIVFRFKAEFSDAELDSLDALFREAFAELTPEGEAMYALDWQHESYRFDPHSDYTGMPIGVFPDGDYFIILSEQIDMGTFGHPWQGTICVFGDKLVRFIESRQPSIFERIERRNTQPGGGTLRR